jgi:hypothetical protein
MYNLENPWKTSSTYDYLIPPNVNSTPLWVESHMFRRVPLPTFPRRILSLQLILVLQTPRRRIHHISEKLVNSPLSDPVDQKSAVTSLLPSTLNCPSPSSESNPSCDMASSVRNTAEIRHT